MCSQERFSLYKFSSQAYPLFKRIGPLATPQLPFLLCLSFTFLLLKPKNPKYLSFSVCSPFLNQCHLSTSSAPRGIDILIYRKATIDPLDLRVIKNRLLAW